MKIWTVVITITKWFYLNFYTNFIIFRSFQSTPFSHLVLHFGAHVSFMTKPLLIFSCGDLNVNDCCLDLSGELWVALWWQLRLSLGRALISCEQGKHGGQTELPSHHHLFLQPYRGEGWGVSPKVCGCVCVEGDGDWNPVWLAVWLMQIAQCGLQVAGGGS